MLALLMLLAGPTSGADLDFAGARIVVSEDASDMEVFAAREFSRYFRLLCGKASEVAADPGAGAAILVGATDDWPANTAEQTYRVNVLSERPARLQVTGKTPVAVQYAAYALLERLGVGFYLGGDALPERRPQLLVPADLDETRSPVFRIRGSLPWYNFLNSPTTWDLEDYQRFFDQMAKMKMNFVGFHSYDHEPFCAYPWEGQWRMGQPAATSLTYWWGTIRHLATKDFGFGTGRYFPYEAFGSRSAVLASEPQEPSAEGAPLPHRTAVDDAIVRAQCVLAQGLQYATQRGVKVCVGFELTGDPTNAENRRQTAARIRHMLATYPMVEYVWFWQSEGLGGGSDPTERDTPLDLIVQRYRPVFEYLGSENRIHEAARVAVWTQFAHGVVRRTRPDIGVGVSGWGGDRWMRFSDFYVGLDKVLPEDIIFTALDNIDPSWEPNVSAAYGQLSPTREKWPIPWWESDGGGLRRDQWGPQCNVKPFTSLVRDAQAKGCQGILGIHWQTRGVEEVAAYVAQFAWNPELTYEQFYETFARKCYGDDNAPEMAELHMRLEALGPRLTGSRGQVECGGFQWFSDDARPKPENLEVLREVLATAGAALSEATTWTAQERLRYLNATVRFLLAFDQAALLLQPEGEIEQLLQQAEAAKTAGETALAKQHAEEALRRMAATTLPEAMDAYVPRLTSQGDCGNLATINVKACAAFLGLWERAAAVLGETRAVPEGLHSTHAVLRFPPTAVPERTPLTLELIAADGSPLELVYRRGGQTQVRGVPVSRPRGAAYAATIPAEAIGPEGVELQVRCLPAGVVDGIAQPVWPGGWDDWYPVSALPGSGPAVYGPYPQDDGAQRATALSATEYETCRVDARAGGEVQEAQSLYHFAWFPSAGEVTLRATDATGRRTTFASSAPPQPVAPPAPASAQSELAGPYLARVAWDPVPGAATYELHRSAEPNFTPSQQTRIAEWPWTVYDDVGLISNTTYEWAVVAVNDAGLHSDFTRTRELYVPDQPPAKPPTGLVAAPGPGRVTLTWQPSPERVSGYAVHMRAGDGAPWERIGGQAPLKAMSYVVGGLPDTNPRQFAVTAIDRGGREGEWPEPVAAAARATPVEPVLAIRFDSDKAETGQQGTLGGKASIHDGLLDTSEGGWIAFPREENLQLAGPLTVEFRIQLDKVAGIPVMVSFGHYQGLGYWMQLIGGQIRWYLPVQKILDAGAIPGAGWHHLCGTYDGHFSRLYIDGQEVGRLDAGQVDLTPWPGEFRIGMYSDIHEQFQTHAQFDDVRVYQRALSAEEVQQHAAGR
jgi:hypothetical protein